MKTPNSKVLVSIPSTPDTVGCTPSPKRYDEDWHQQHDNNKSGKVKKKKLRISIDIKSIIIGIICISYMKLFLDIRHTQKQLNAVDDIDLDLPDIQQSNNNICKSNNAITINDQIHGKQTHQLLFKRKHIPGLNEQTTLPGKSLTKLVSFDGRLHIGYGDQSGNSGPIDMYSYDPIHEKKWLYHGQIQTEEIGVFRVSSDSSVMYTVEIDGHGTEREDEVYVNKLQCGSTQRWSTVGEPVHAAHIYTLDIHPPCKNHDSIDTNIEQNTILVGTGSRHGQRAQVLSNTGNNRWTEVFWYPSSDDHFNRISNAIVTNSISRNNTTGPTMIIFGVKYGDCKSEKGDECAFGFISYNFKMNSSDNSYIPITSLELPYEDAKLLPRRTPQATKPPQLQSVPFHDELYFVGYRFRRNDHYIDYTGTYKIITDSKHSSSASLKRVDPWPRINGKKTVFRCWIYNNPSKFLVLVMEPNSQTYGVFRTNGYMNRNITNWFQEEVWEELLILKRPLHKHNEFVSMALLQNDLYLGTKSGDLHVIKELYQPSSS